MPSTSDLGLEALTATDSGAGAAVAVMGAVAAGAAAVAAVQFAPLSPIQRPYTPAPYVPGPSRGAYNNYGAPAEPAIFRDAGVRPADDRRASREPAQEDEEVRLI
jgi:hypothetical protein